jgi:hypothetical protein
MKVQRFSTNPLLYANHSPSIGANLNGPSVIKVPGWVKNPLGKYYLYFAHHQGLYIRLAYADTIEGPWTVYEPGTLHLEQTACVKHIASPDVHIDDARQQIRMYFHGPVPHFPSGMTVQPNTAKQVSFVAFSSNGLEFEAHREILGAPYFRVFKHRDWFYALGMPGVFYRSNDGITSFEQGPILFNQNMRHSALHVVGERLWVYYSSVGDEPEHILRSSIDLTPDWLSWQASPPQDVLLPEKDHEGADLPLEPSVRGWAPKRVRQLRDPAIYEQDGKVYLFYSIAGEYGLAGCCLEE